MRLLIDESVKGHIVRALPKRFDIIKVATVAPGVQDVEVVALAAELGAVLLTEDRGIPWTTMQAPKKPAGVVVIEAAGISRDEQRTRTAAALDELGDAILGIVTIIRRTTYRRRTMSLT